MFKYMWWLHVQSPVCYCRDWGRRLS